MQPSIMAGDDARITALEAFADAMTTGGARSARPGDSGRPGVRRRGRGRARRPAGSTRGRDDVPSHRAGRRPRSARVRTVCTDQGSAPAHVATHAAAHRPHHLITRRVPRPPAGGPGVTRAFNSGHIAHLVTRQADLCPDRSQEVAGRAWGDRKIEKSSRDSDDFPEQEQSLLCDDACASTGKPERRGRGVRSRRLGTTRRGPAAATVREAVLAASAVATMPVCK